MKKRKQKPGVVATELTVGELAKRSGVAVSAIHFYESKGLITSWRNQGNQRRYAREMLRRVAVIKVAQRVGIPLSAVSQAFESLPEGRTPNAEDWGTLSARWRTTPTTSSRGKDRVRDCWFQLNRGGVEPNIQLRDFALAVNPCAANQRSNKFNH